MTPRPSYPRAVAKFDHAQMSAIEARRAKYIGERAFQPDELRPPGKRVEDLIKFYAPYANGEKAMRRGPLNPLDPESRRRRSEAAKKRWAKARAA